MYPVISDAQIDAAKKNIRCRSDLPLHEHNDCIRFAYQWLDAQTKTKTCTSKTYPLKHVIEKWAGRYVSTSDVEVAASLHPDIVGNYPHFNISARLTEPSTDRLKGLSEAFSQDYRERHEADIYKSRE